MEIRQLPLYPFTMLLKAVMKRWLAVPLAALFLLFGTGAAAAPDCHIESTVQSTSQSEVVHSHTGHPHSHSPQRSTLTAKQFSLPRYQLPLFLSKNLGYLNLTHLQLGIIRI